MNEFDVKGFDYDEFERKYEKIKKTADFFEYTKPLSELVKDSKTACLMLPLYPLDAVKEFLKYIVYYKDVSGVRARLFSEKYLYLGGGFPIYKLLALWGDEKYYQMIAELKDLAKSE